jgi:hypothetical protein
MRRNALTSFATIAVSTITFRFNPRLADRCSAGNVTRQTNRGQDTHEKGEKGKSEKGEKGKSRLIRKASASSLFHFFTLFLWFLKL